MDFNLSDWTHEELTLEGAFGIDFEMFKQILNQRMEYDGEFYDKTVYEVMYTCFHKLFCDLCSNQGQFHYIVLLDNRSRVLCELFYVIFLEEAQAEEKEKLKGIIKCTLCQGHL